MRSEAPADIIIEAGLTGPTMRSIVCERCGYPRYAVHEGPLLDRHREVCNQCYRAMGWADE